MTGGKFTDILKHPSLGSTNDIHHVFVVTPFLRFLQHLLKQALAIFILCQLENRKSLCWNSAPTGYPLTVITEKRSDRILTHIGSNGQRIDIITPQRMSGHTSSSAANVPTFGINDDEVVGIVFIQIIHGGFAKAKIPSNTIRLVESQVWLVGYTIGSCCIDNEGVKLARGL